MNSDDAAYTDPGLLRKFSEVIPVTTDSYNYPGVRIFYREHPKASVLPPKLPLLVFIHGMESIFASAATTKVNFS